MKLVITQNITLDGVIEAIDDWFSPENGYDSDDLTTVLQEQMARQVGFLVGRTTFEDMRGYWPDQTGDTTGIADHLSSVQKYVVSRTMADPQWEPTTVLRDVAAVTALKERPGGDLGVTGSISVCHALISAGLVDEYRLFVYPVVVGRGRRLFAENTHVRGLRLTDSRRFERGVALLTYTQMTSR